MGSCIGTSIVGTGVVATGVIGLMHEVGVRAGSKEDRISTVIV